MISATPALKSDRRLCNADELGEMLGGRSAGAIHQHRRRGHFPEEAIVPFGPRLILFDYEAILADLQPSPPTGEENRKGVITMT